jgi:hypothetical protein
MTKVNVFSARLVCMRNLKMRFSWYKMGNDIHFIMVERRILIKKKKEKPQP